VNGEGVTHIVEVKMFKSDRPEDTIKKNLEGGLRRLLDNRQKLIATNPAWANITYFFITNIMDESYYTELVDSFKTQLIGANVYVYSPDQFKKAHFSGIYRNKS